MTISQACIKLWTSNSGVFKQINRILIKDDLVALQSSASFIRICTNHIVRDHDADSSRVRGDITTFRGSKMTSAQIGCLRPGMVIRSPIFTATSTSKHVAESFREGAGFLVAVGIPDNAYGARFVDRHSAYNSEQEVLVKPYEPFEIVSIDAQEKVVYVTLLDGANQRLDVPVFAL